MANYTTTTHRPSSTNSPPPPPGHDTKPDDPTRKNIYTLNFSWPFNIPSTPESAAIRIVKNLANFSLYYAIFVWTVLFIALIPKRKVSVIYLVAMTEITLLYFLLMRSFAVLHKMIDKRFVLFLLFIVTAVEMILTRAAIHLFIVLGATVPLIVVHAVLSKGEDVFVNKEDGEMVRLVVNEKLGDDHAENLV
ncbi:hypothetical protein BUALT_Bualt01G0193200 [Buddleja alternifolia]|uniref:PRA1 family protein n=1 Tax=Buddleja alternifolia TaxID=168488 RepID=A0AAV6Y8E0_9LAMI|nr:hypothetical protein BUALT_Bualt01G0193200 [Buddleja alternifolia]